MRALWLVAWRSLTRSRGRSLVAGLGIMVGVALFMTTHMIVWGIDLKAAQWNKGEYGQGVAALLVPLSPADPGLDQAAVEAAAAVPGVERLIPRIRVMAKAAVPGSLADVALAFVDPTAEAGLQNLRLLEGEFPAQATDLLVPLPFALKHNLTVGDSITVRLAGNRRITGQITGLIADEGLGVINQSGILVGALTHAEAWGFTDGPTQALITAPGIDRTQLTTALSAAVEGKAHLRPPEPTSRYWGVAFAQLMALMRGLGLLVGGLLTWGALALTWQRRRRMVGLEMALGATGRQVSLTLALEAGALGALAAVPGTLLGIGLGRLALSTWVTQVGSMPLLLETVPIPWGGVLAAILLGAGTAVVAGLAPSRALSRLPVVSALADRSLRRPGEQRVPLIGLAFALLGLAGTFSLPMPFGALGVLLFLVGLIPSFLGLIPGLLQRVHGLFSRRLSATGLIALRSLERDPRQSGNAGAALMAALALVIAYSGITHSVWQSTDRQVAGMSADLILQGDLSPAAVTAIRTAESITQLATPGRVFLGANGEGGLNTLAVEADYLDLARPNLIAGEPVEAFQALLAGRGVLVGSRRASQNGWQVGSTLYLRGSKRPDPPLELPVVGVVEAAWEEGTDLWLGREIALQLGELTTDVGYIRLASGADLPGLRAQIAAAHPLLALQSRAEFRAAQLLQLRNDWRPLQAVLYATIVMALLGLTSTFMGLVAEQQRSLALLLAIGAQPRQILRLLLGQALLLGLLATGAGILVGSVLLLAFGEITRQLGLVVPLSYPWQAGLSLMLVGPLLAVLAAGVAALAAVRLRPVGHLQQY